MNICPGKEREELEDAEEEEAMKIQLRLAEEIDEDQFEIFQVLFKLFLNNSIFIFGNAQLSYFFKF